MIVTGRVAAAGLVPLLAAIAAGAPGSAAAAPASPPPRTVRVTPADWSGLVGDDGVLEGPAGGLRVLLSPGVYRLDGRAFVDSTCGNCEEAATPVPASVGLVLRGEVSLEGAAAPGAAVLETGAGYGLLAEDCRDCALRGLQITGGVRDPDARATDGAVVARRSRLLLEDCELRDNVGDPATVAEIVVGIVGIVGREGADLEVRRCRILRNSWDGIALYRGARAVVEDCVVDGVDAASGGHVGGGRGVGIGVTWDAEAELRRNLVRRYWKGIGIFVDADVVAERNVVEDVLTWGIALWDAGRGRPRGVLRENLVCGTGACGISVTQREAGREAGACRDNLLVRTGQNPRYDDPDLYCLQRPLAVHVAPVGFGLAGNLLLDNRRAEPADERVDLTRSRFLAVARPLLAALLAAPATGESAHLAGLAAAAGVDGAAERR